MTDLEQSLALAADFPQASRQEWRKLVDAVLKGTSLEGLVGTSYDGLAMAPLAGRRAEALPVAARARAGLWQIMARIDHPDPARAAEAVRKGLANGATALSLVFTGAVGDYGFGLPARGEVLARLLEGIDPGDDVAVEFDLSPHAEAALDAALAKDPTFASPAKRWRLGHDPLGACARSADGARSWGDTAPHFARRLAALVRAGLNQNLAVADGRIVHNAGGSEAQELAFVLAAALAYLRALEAEGIALEDARKMIFFRLAADAEQFLTVAKFRAMRKLWARVEAVCGLAPAPVFISAETAWRMMAQRDAQVNILRSTVAVFAAALGGADAIAVLPYSAPLGPPDNLARRIARNTQLILIEEAHLAKVADPAAGAGAVEDLTDGMCRAAWRLLQEIEAAGGLSAALEAGLIQNKVAAVRAQRVAALAHGKDALTGVSIFPNLAEAPLTLPRAATPGSAMPLASIRLASPYEELRDASDRRLGETGARPKVFLACLGAESEFTPRASFAKNFFEAGGIEAADGHGDTTALAAAFTGSGATLACICGSEKSYDSGAPALAAALRAAGARHIYLAGAPGAREQTCRDAGVETFIYTGCDTLAVLQEAQRLCAA